MSPQQWTPPTSDKQAWTPPAADAQAAKPIPGNTPEERRQYLIAHPDAAKANREATSAPFQSKEPEGSAAGRFLEGLVSPITGPAREIWQFVSDHDAWVRQHGGNSQNDVMSLPGAPQAMQAGTGDVAGAVGGTLGQVGLAALQAKMAGPRILNERGAPGMPAALESIDTALRTAADPGVVRAGVKVLPKGPAAVAAYDAVQTARARIAAERMGPAPASWNGTPVNAWEGMPDGPPVAPPSWTAPPVNAWEGMPEAAAPVAAAETPGQALARQSNTDWAKLSPTDQAMLEQVAKAQQNVAAQPARAPMGPPAAAAPVEATPRGQTLAEMLAAEFDARKAAEPAVSSPPIGAHPASPPINGRGAPLRPPLAQGPVEAPPVVEAPPAPPARVRMSPDELQAAEDDMAATLPAPGDPQPGRSQYYPNGEAKSPQVLVQEGIRYARTQKAGKLAQALADSGVTSEAAANMKYADWKALAEKNDLPWPKGGHGETIAETLFNLRKLLDARRVSILDNYEPAGIPAQSESSGLPVRSVPGAENARRTDAALPPVRSALQKGGDPSAVLQPGMPGEVSQPRAISSRGQEAQEALQSEPRPEVAVRSVPSMVHEEARNPNILPEEVPSASRGNGESPTRIKVVRWQDTPGKPELGKAGATWYLADNETARTNNPYSANRSDLVAHELEAQRPLLIEQGHVERGDLTKDIAPQIIERLSPKMGLNEISSFIPAHLDEWVPDNPNIEYLSEELGLSPQSFIEALRKAEDSSYGDAIAVALLKKHGYDSAMQMSDNPGALREVVHIPPADANPGASSPPTVEAPAPPVSKEEAAFNKRKAARDKKKKP